MRLSGAFLAVAYSAAIRSETTQFGEGRQLPSNVEHLREPISLFIEEYIKVSLPRWKSTRGCSRLGQIQNGYVTVFLGQALETAIF